MRAQERKERQEEFGSKSISARILSGIRGVQQLVPKCFGLGLDLLLSVLVRPLGFDIGTPMYGTRITSYDDLNSGVHETDKNGKMDTPTTARDADSVGEGNGGNCSSKATTFALSTKAMTLTLTAKAMHDVWLSGKGIYDVWLSGK
eukprot:1393877-Amorphochlora_amoeboformis.AAC.1